jgi:hypothetical protein
MSILQELEESMHSDAPSYMEFLYRYDPKKKQVFAFYEGDEDSSFYHRILETAIESDCELEEIVAGCKNNVLKLHREFDWGIYNSKQIVFFVDRDLSYWLGDSAQYGENVFVTDEYSVENYVANSQGFRAWLIHFEGFARAKKQEIDSMVSEYESSVAIFKEEMMPIMAQAVVAKRHDSSISLSAFKITSNKSILFSIQEGHMTFEICKGKSILEKWKLSSENQDEVTKQIEQFTIEKSNYSVRGKWILCFMAEVGEYMRLNSNIFAPSLGNTGKTAPTCSVPTAQCLSVLAPYCTKSVPKRLDEFLNNTYQGYFTKAS